MKKFIIDLIYGILMLLLYLWLYDKVGFESTIIVMLCYLIVDRKR